MAETEDIPYEISDHAVADPETTSSEDQSLVNDETIQKIYKYLEEAVAEHNSLDLIDLTEAAKMTPTQQIAVHKLVTNHLQNIKEIINNKVEEQ